MPNLNLLDGKDFQREIEKIDQNAISYKSFQTEESEPEPEEMPVVGESAPEKTTEQKVPETEETIRFDERRSNRWIFVGAVGVVILIFGLIYFLNRGKSESEQTQIQSAADSTRVSEVVAKQDSSARSTEEMASGPTTQPSGQSPPAETRVSETPAGEKPISIGSEPALVALDADRKGATTGATLLSKVIERLPEGIKLSFFKYGENRLDVEVAAKNENLLADFWSSLRANILKGNATLLAKRENLLGDEVYIFQKITGSVLPDESVPSPSNELSGTQARSNVRRLATSSGLQVLELKLSPVVSLGKERLRWLTLKATGSGAAVSSFMRSLVGKYRNVGINSVVLSALSAQQILSGTAQASIDVTIYTP